MVSVLNSFYPAAQDLEPTPDVVSVARDYVQNPKGFRELVISPALHALKWAEWGGVLNQLGKESKEIIGIVGHVFFWFDLPTDVRKLAESIEAFRGKILNGSFRERAFCSKELFVNSALMGDLVAETLELANAKEIIHFSASQLALVSAIGFLGSTGVTISAASGASKELRTFMNTEIGTPRFKLALIKLIGKVCLVVVGILGMATFLTGMVVPGVVLIALSTLLLFCTIAGIFYSKLYVKTVEDKGANQV